MEVDGWPLNNEEECRDAWDYANSDQARDEYEPDELDAFKAKIRDAGEKYGLHLGGKVAAAADLNDIELARPGTWKLSTGPLTVTPQMLDDVARFANRDGARPAPVKIGHTDTRFMAGDGEPALGWVHNVRLEEDDAGPVLKGDLKGMPDWLAAAAPLHWPDRSIEGWAGYEHDGQKYSLVMSALALLGVTPPGMSSLKSLRDLPAVLGLPVQAGATRVIASFGEDPTTPAVQAAGSPPKRTGAGMDPDQIREALGLEPDASDEAVREAFVAAFPTSPTDTPAPVAASGALPEGTMVLASSVWEQTQDTIRKLTAYVDQAKRNDRDDVIAKAVQAGKFTPAQKPHFAKLWDADPDGTRNLIGALTPNSALAVAAAGYEGEGIEADPEYAALFGGYDPRKEG